jgi:hypothetical protein
MIVSNPYSARVDPAGMLRPSSAPKGSSTKPRTAGSAYRRTASMLAAWASIALANLVGRNDEISVGKADRGLLVLVLAFAACGVKIQKECGQFVQACHHAAPI